MMYFKEFIEKQTHEYQKKLSLLYDTLKGQPKHDIFDHSDDRNNPYVFIRVKIKSETYDKLSDLNLGVKVFNIGNKLVYRLQNGSFGHPIGPSKILEDREEIEDKIEQGMTEEEAYIDLFKNIPETILKFMEDVYQNIENSLDRRNPVKMDPATDRQLLNSIVTALFA